MFSAKPHQVGNLLYNSNSYRDLKKVFIFLVNNSILKLDEGKHSFCAKVKDLERNRERLILKSVREDDK